MSDTENISVHEVYASSIITPSKLPESDYVINPYIGCEYGCKYCYAKFMKRFTGHKEAWGKFVDIKTSAAELVPDKPSTKYTNKTVTIGSVTDLYQPLESKYHITRDILKKLVVIQPYLCVITKSSLVVRDIDLFKKFKKCKIAISLFILDEDIRKQFEPRSCTVGDRLDTLERLHAAGIYTVLFISPIFPQLTDWKSLILKTKSYVDEYWFENLNMYPAIKSDIYRIISTIDSTLVDTYSQIYSKGNNYWRNEENAIKEFCKKQHIKSNFYFHHKKLKDSIN